MSKYGFLVGVAAVLSGALTLSTSTAEGQARQAVSMTGAPALSAPAARPQADDSVSERTRNPMAPAGIGVKVGLAGIGVAKYTLKEENYHGRIDSRRGVMVSLPIHLGGGGFGWTLEPFLSKSSIRHELKNATGVVTGSEQADLTAYGLYTGPVYNIHVANPLYIGLGLGLKAAYVMNDSFDVAVDGYGRIPLSTTYYLTNNFALMAEVGIGYGLSVFIDKPEPVVDAVTREVRNATDDPQFGKALAWDFSFGVRLP